MLAKEVPCVGICMVDAALLNLVHIYRLIAIIIIIDFTIHFFGGPWASSVRRLVRRLEAFAQR